MAKININFNNKNYNIDAVSLDHASASLKSHLSTVMNGEGTTINFGDAAYGVDSTKLATATNDFIPYLGTIAGNGIKVIIGGVEYSVDDTKLNNTLVNLKGVFEELEAISNPPLAPGLYEAGAIALWKEGDYDAASAMMATSWEELEENGVLAVGEGVILPDNLPELNEYGFYYGVPYSMTMQGVTLSLAFNEDGSAVFDQAGQIMEFPAGSAIYSDHAIDMTTTLGGIIVVLPGGHDISLGEALLSIGSGFPAGELCVFNLSMISGDLVLSNTVTRIPNAMFAQHNDLTGLFISSEVISIGSRALFGCKGLVSVAVANGNSYYHIAGDCLIETASKTLLWGCNTSVIPTDGSVTIINDGAFYYCEGLTSMTIPDGVTSINQQAFKGCQYLTSITIPNSVTNIGDLAFEDCSNLATVTLGANSKLTSIGYRAFCKCYDLTSMTIPDGVTSIGELTFSGCQALTSITIPASVTSIGLRAFENCYKLTTVEFGANSQLTSIGISAFSNCMDLTSVTIPASVTSIGQSAFSYCRGLTSMTIPDGVTNIGQTTFADCRGLTSVTIPDSVTSIDIQAFRDCVGLTTVEFGANSKLTSIGEGVFWVCSQLTTITIPASVTSIGQNAFLSCSKLASIAFTGTKAQWNAITKGDNWNTKVPATHVHCTDGDVAL